jgi:hypothetical protein
MKTEEKRVKKQIIRWSLAIFLVAVLVGGMSATVIAGPPLRTLLVTINSGIAPSNIAATGQNWTPGVEVKFYLDTEDAAHQMSVATPAANGSIMKNFPLGSTPLGTHKIIAVQGINKVEAQFVITTRQPVDDVTWDYLKFIYDSVGSPDYGLEEIKREVAIIEDAVTSKEYGLEEIQDEVEDIQDEFEDIQDHVATMEVYNGHYSSTDPFVYWQTIVDDSYSRPWHITLTFHYSGINNMTQGIIVESLLGPEEDSEWFTQNEIVGGTDPDNRVVTLDFVAVGWNLRFKNGIGTPINIHWDAVAEGLSETPL